MTTSHSQGRYNSCTPCAARYLSVVFFEGRATGRANLRNIHSGWIAWQKSRTTGTNGRWPLQASLLVLSPAKISETLGSPLCFNFRWRDICDCNSPQNGHGLLPAKIADTSVLSLGLSFMCLARCDYNTPQYRRLFNLFWFIWLIIIGCGRIGKVCAWERATGIRFVCSWFPWLLLIHCWKPWAVRSG